MTTLTEVITGNFTEYEIESRIHATSRMFQRNINNEKEDYKINEQKFIQTAGYRTR